MGRPGIVHVGSNLYRRVRVELPFDDLAAERSYSRGRAYLASKLANLLFGVELDRRLSRAGRPIRSLTAHPGMASTPMNAGLDGLAQRMVLATVKAAIARPAERAAIPLLYAATAADARPGVFIGPSIRKWDDRVYFDALVAPADDLALAARLWDLAQARTGVEYLDDVLL
jgi:NAD(P)-dependent dehydrogenase (short-subunit alcohol dehydrogenase family)